MTAESAKWPVRATSSTRMAPRKVYNLVAIAESVTWTLLIIGMILKYVAGLGQVPVVIGGSIHGFVFITYALTAVLVGVNQRWTVARIALAVATAIVPYATIPFDRHLVRHELLDGGWHREATGDSDDQTWTRIALRWLLNHPLTLVVTFIVGIVVIMTALLNIGPPGSWGS